MSKIELIKVGESLYPAAITNHSLRMGEKLGLLKGSHLPDLIESNHHVGIIYLSVIGMNEHLELSLSDFLERYTPGPEEIKENYKNIITSCTDIKENNFAKSFQMVTKKSKGKDEKRRKPPKLNFECAEDRYVYYCLIYGIDGNIFWHHPILDVERIFQGKQAYDGWNNNPVTY